jgi:hypothetical protein
MELEEEENNRGNQQNIQPNNPSHGSSSSTKTVPVKNDDQYIWISMQAVVFF